jgi:hypothetical protein
MALEGLNAVIRNLNKQLDRMGAATKEGLHDVALDLQGKSQRLAPVDTGDLRGSAYTEVEKEAGGYVAEIGFKQIYSIVQHENLEYEHPRGGQAKYLEQPAKENINRYVRHIAEKNREVNR